MYAKNSAICTVATRKLGTLLKDISTQLLRGNSAIMLYVFNFIITSRKRCCSSALLNWGTMIFHMK